MRLGKKPSQAGKIVIPLLLARADVGDPKLELRFALVGVVHAVLVLVHEPQVEVLKIHRIRIGMLVHEKTMHRHRPDENDARDVLGVMQAFDRRTHFLRRLPIPSHYGQLHGKESLNIGNVSPQWLRERLLRSLTQQNGDMIRLCREKGRCNEEKKDRDEVFDGSESMTMEKSNCNCQKGKQGSTSPKKPLMKSPPSRP